MTPGLRTVVLGQRGINSVWEALRAEGYSETELRAAPELVAWAAERNGLHGFRRIESGWEIDIPQRAIKDSVIAEVRESPKRYEAALQLVRADMQRTTRGLAAPKEKPIGQRDVLSLPLVQARVGEPAVGRAFAAGIAARASFGSATGVFAKEHAGKNLDFAYNLGFFSLDERVIASASAVHEYRSEFDEYGTRDWRWDVRYEANGNIGPFISVLRHESGVLANASLANSTAETYRQNGNRVTIDELLSPREIAQIRQSILAELKRKAPRLTSAGLEESLKNSFAVFSEGGRLRLAVVVPAKVYAGETNNGAVSEFVFDVSKSTKLRQALGRSRPLEMMADS